MPGFVSGETRTENTLRKLERLNTALRHEEPDRVPISDFFWGGFIRRWREELELPEDQALTAEVARDLAVREGYPAVIEGELTSVGDGFVITARLADARSEETLASLRETAADANEIIPAIDRLSGKMREKIGDSYTNMRADEPLEQVTTSSLEALEKYSRALELFAAGTGKVECPCLDAPHRGFHIHGPGDDDNRYVRMIPVNLVQ